MVLCVCNVLRDLDIAACATTKCVRSAAEVFEAMDCEPRCSSCVPEIEELLTAAQASR